MLPSSRSVEGAGLGVAARHAEPGGEQRGPPPPERFPSRMRMRGGAIGTANIAR
jgi:hypothetical protein